MPTSTTNTSTSATNSTSTAGASASRRASASSGMADTQEQFMTLLVSQMKYQDPLNPMDNAQMTSQIAQINTVSGVNQLNETVESLAAQFGAMQSLQASGLLGRDAWVASDRMQLRDGVGQWVVDLPNRVDGLDIDVLDPSGNVVYTQQLGPQAAGQLPLYWDGMNDAGVQSPDGPYTVRARQTVQGEVNPVSTWTSARVLSVGMTDGASTLELDGLGLRAMSDIRRLSIPLDALGAGV